MSRETIERWFEAMEAQKWDLLEESLHPDFVEEWPQSGERIRGWENFRALNENYPVPVQITPRRITGAGDVWTAEVTIDYEGKPSWQGVSIFEMKDGKIWKQTDYFAEPFEAPEWRSQWVEKM